MAFQIIRHAFRMVFGNLREALKVLSSEGLVTLATNRGATVTKLAPEEVAETFPVMGALEALAGELACTSATDAQLAELLQQVERRLSGSAGADRSAVDRDDRNDLGAGAGQEALVGGVELVGQVDAHPEQWTAAIVVDHSTGAEIEVADRSERDRLDQ